MVFAENHENPSPVSQMFTYVVASKLRDTGKTQILHLVYGYLVVKVVNS